MNWYKIFKYIAFKIDPESVHHFTIKLMSYTAPFLPRKKIPPQFSFKRNRLRFPSPFGLAAGLDKNGEAISFLTKLPFGSVEIGTVTPKAQIGNERPRLFRYLEIESLRNRMGFNNAGKVAMLKNIQHSKKHGRLLGVNVGKNKTTANEDSKFEYLELLKFFDHELTVDYLVINVSSPNTPGLRNLLQDSGLRGIFEALSSEKFQKPIYLKISPDMSFDDIDRVLEVMEEFHVSGLVATNTTINAKYGEGGMSGKILFEKARAVRSYLLQKLKNHPKIHLIGVGGFSTFEEIKEYWIEGGDAVQLYSSFIFQGPKMLYKFEKKLRKDMRGFKVHTFDDYLHKIRKQNQ